MGAYFLDTRLREYDKKDGSALWVPTLKSDLESSDIFFKDNTNRNNPVQERGY